MSKVASAKFKAKTTIFRATTMSIALAKAGIISDAHLVRDFPKTALVRNKHDFRNIRPSIEVRL